MLEQLKKEVLKANLDLPAYKLVTLTWGNVSGIDRGKGMIVIKPSGVPYNEMEVGHMVVLDLNGNVIEGDLKPSSDTPTHLVLYKSFNDIGGIVHTHSPWATSWAQAGKGIAALGTTHADYFHGEIPCTRKMKREEISNDYEKKTGHLIVETFEDKNENEIPAVLVNSHGPFVWGENAVQSVHNAVVLEEMAKMAYNTFNLNPLVHKIDKALMDKHFLRKHGKNAYYGQAQ